MSTLRASGRMGVRFSVVSSVVAAIVLAGCGGSSHNATSSGTATATTATQLPPGAPPPALRSVRGRVLTAGELAGFEPGGSRLLGIGPTSWVVGEELPRSQRAREVARLQRLGFVAAVGERLHPSGGGPAEGLSIVEQLRSPGSARREVAFALAHNHGPGFSEFAVPAIPGARGFGGSSSATSGINVAFAKGSYYYLVGAGWPAGTASVPTRATVIAAALRLYDRV
jgi:hypothetical protein